MLMVGMRKDIMDFEQTMTANFKVASINIDKKLVFDRLLIQQAKEFSIEASTEEYLQQISPICIGSQRRKKKEEPCSNSEIASFRSLGSSPIFFGQSVLLAAAFGASYLQW